jgi:hypothetical protein
MKILFAAPMMRTCDFGRSCAKALVSLGNEVHEWDYRSRSVELGLEESNRLLAKKFRAEPFDLLFVIKGEFIDPKIVKFAHKRGVATAIWNVDDPHLPHLTTTLSPFFDHIFTPMLQAHPMYEALQRPKLLPLTCSDEYKPLRTEEEPIDISFIGTAYAGRAEVLDAVRVKFPDRIIKYFGSGWPEVQRLPDQEAVNVISTSKINLVISQKENLEYGVINPRVFEILACRRFALVDNHIGIRTFFHPRHMEIYYDLNDLLHRTARALLDPKGRASCAWLGYKEYHKCHTAEKRMQTMLKLMRL